MRALDELLKSWRSNPDADATIAACSYLGSSDREELIREVGASAETWHGGDARVMLAVGRMYLDAAMLQEAQTSLVAAGKAQPRDASAFRYLGEVLLRRGDAQRAEKVLARAVELGGAEDDVELWHERAVLYSALQKRVGPEAVAAEVARSMPTPPSVPAPPESDPLPSFGLEEATRPRNEARGASAVARKPTLAGLAEAAPLPRFDSSDPLRDSADSIRLSESDLEDEVGAEQLRAAALPRPSAALTAPRAAVGLPSRLSPSSVEPAPAPREPAPSPPPPRAPQAQPALPPPPVMLAAPPAPVRAPPPVVAGGLPSYVPAPATVLAFEASPAPPLAGAPAPHEALTTLGFEPAAPHPSAVLQHLASVGLYEPGGGAAPAWEAPPRQRSRGAIALLVATLVVAVLGGGTYEYMRRLKVARAAEADTLNAQVETLLRSGSPAELQASEQRLTKSFELDSLSQRAGRLWLHNRVLSALLIANGGRGLDAAVHRGRQVGMPENELLVGKVASFLVEGDVAGGAALLVRGDKEAGDDAYYQLAAAAVLERAGDPRAVERYRAAVRLAPELAPAEMLLARLLLLEAGPERAKPVIDSLRKKRGDTPSTRALSALAWVLAPARMDEPPAEAQLGAGDADALPAPLSAVPAMVEAAKALGKRDLPAASKAIDSAIGLTMTPALAAGLGFVAIEAGDEVVARKAALRALQFSAVYPRARTLAARVALLGGRVDEAQKAIEELEPSSADVAVVRAVVAYESLEASDLKSALEALGNSAVGPAFAALESAPGIIDGSAFPPADQLESLAAPDKPWGELIAVDAAIETGNLVLADQVLSKRSAEALRPVHLRRVARLRRLQGKLDEALRASAVAAEAGVGLPLLVERIYELLDKDDVGAAKQLAAKYPSLLGPLAGWVGVLTDVASNQAASAAVRLTKLELPPEQSPLLVKVLVGRALVVAKDKRASAYLTALQRRLPKNPDVAWAARAGG
jgi:tetratricopeptide (TPR) repeat protein